MPDERMRTRPTTELGQPDPAMGRQLAADDIHKLLILALAYCATGGIGLLLAIPPGYATAVWPPSGLALAAILLWGPRVWPGIWLGSFLVNLWVALSPAHAQFNLASLAVAASIGAGSTMQAVLGAFLLQRWLGVARIFETGPTVLSFVAIEALACLLASTWGVATLTLAGILDPGAYADLWRTWWLGDVTGVLLVAPLMLTWRQMIEIVRRPKQAAEAVGLLTLLVVLTVSVFFGLASVDGRAYPLAVLPLACLVWIAFRMNPGSVALATLLVSGVAIFATARGVGPFARGGTVESMLLLQSFTSLIVLTALTLAAAAAGHKRSETSLRRLCAEMERLAVTDELTSIHNRRGFFIFAEQGLRLARRTQTKSLLLFADLDGLKHVNDTLGHAAGDTLIVDAARLLVRVFRESDVIARLGGDEFAVLAFVDDSDTSAAVGNRLKDGIAELNRQTGRIAPLSLSVGIEELHASADASLETLVSRADHAMYGRKRARTQPV